MHPRKKAMMAGLYLEDFLDRAAVPAADNPTLVACCRRGAGTPLGAAGDGARTRSVRTGGFDMSLPGPRSGMTAAAGRTLASDACRV